MKQKGIPKSGGKSGPVGGKPKVNRSIQDRADGRGPAFRDIDKAISEDGEDSEPGTKLPVRGPKGRKMRHGR